MSATRPVETNSTRSEVLPGPWLDVAALVQGDLLRVHQVVAEGLASLEHSAFAARNAALQAGSSGG